MSYNALTNAVRRALYTPRERQYLNWELTRRQIDQRWRSPANNNK